MDASGLSSAKVLPTFRRNVRKFHLFLLEVSDFFQADTASSYYQTPLQFNYVVVCADPVEDEVEIPSCGQRSGVRLLLTNRSPANVLMSKTAMKHG